MECRWNEYFRYTFGAEIGAKRSVGGQNCELDADYERFLLQTSVASRLRQLDHRLVCPAAMLTKNFLQLCREYPDLLRDYDQSGIVSDIAVLVLKRDVKLQPTNQPINQFGVAQRRSPITQKLKTDSIYVTHIINIRISLLSRDQTMRIHNKQ